MKKQIALFFFLGLLGCTPASPAPDSIDLDQARTEVRQAEKAFNDLAAREGVPAAFLAFAADSAVLNRNGRIIKGKEAMKAYFDDQPFREVSLNWAPDFVDVAKAGDMAYTYGKFQFSAVDSTGQTVQSEGIFHTVWKKQADGRWKFVYD